MLFSVLLAVAIRTGDAAGAEGDGCPCVILVQVDGLEPKDVTEQTTPYLWRLAHPRVAGTPVAGSGLDGRAGWIWQAPRGVVTTGTASATASLLTGGYPETTGVPADDFYGPGDGGAFVRQRLTAGGFGDAPLASSPSLDVADPIATPGVETLLVEAGNKEDGRAAAFLGDPGLAEVTGKSEANPYWFPPGTDDNSATVPAQQFTGDPRLCPIPRYPDGGGDTVKDHDVPRDAFDPARCPANDLTTMSKALEDLTNEDYRNAGFAFIHLAELGAAKRLAADTDVDGLPGRDPAPPDADGDPTTSPPQPAHALADTDAAIASFVERYAQASGSKWGKTVMMIVGTHGYQSSPLANRVPDPGAVGDQTRDLSDFVKSHGDGSLRLVPQGTTATIYYKPSEETATPDSPAKATARAAALNDIKQALLGDAVAAACQQVNPTLPRCINRVLYVDKTKADSSQTVDGQHPSWHLDARHPDSGVRTKASGDLIVELGRGWATGRSTYVPYQGGAAEGKPLTNANTASAGGPQERAVAALINGPGTQNSSGVVVRDLDQYAGAADLPASQLERYPVSRDSVDPRDYLAPPPIPDDPPCRETRTDPGGLACANRPENVGDDAEATGHEAQPVTVDFAATISALMQLPFAGHPGQLQGRVLQEAFVTELARPCFEDCEPEEVVQPEQPLPELPPPPIEISAPEDPFKFRGLVQKLKSRVVDSKNLPYSRARRGSVLSTIRLEGDFGKPEAAVTLTFYRRSSGAARSSRVVRLKPIARFDPFVVKRGHVTMRLKVPPLFKPTYVGLTVREIAHTANGRRRRSGGQPCTTLRTRTKVPFRCTGPARGVIVRIVDAHRLHKRKPGGRTPRRRR